MQQKANFSPFQMSHSNNLSSTPINLKDNQNIQYSQNETQFTEESFNSRQINQKMISKPIGLYNFNINKSAISSLEESIDEIVSSFLEQNKENIIKYVVNEVQNKLNEKIQPLNTQIQEIKNNYNSVYEQELKNFKDFNILNDCHNNILNIDNKINIINENINKYNNEINRFNISDSRLKFLNKLNKDLEDFINRIQNENERGMDIELDEEKYKLNMEQKKQENVIQDLDFIFNETLTLIKKICCKEKNDTNLEYINIDYIDNNLRNAINDFQMKYNCKEPVLEEKIKDNNKNGGINKNNIFESIPDFFGIGI